jgi:hypothetical protein
MKGTCIFLVHLILGATGVCPSAFSAAGNLPAEVRGALEDPTAFQISAAVSAIPNSVRTSFAKAAGEKSFSMAEPGAEWQSTDVVYKLALPHRRLGHVALSKSFCILFYERGGRGWSYHVAVFRLAQNDAKLLWSGSAFQKVPDPAGLLIAIKKGQIEDSDYL